MPTPISTTHELREEALHEAGVRLLRESDHNVRKSDTGNLIVDGKTIYNHEWQAIIHGKHEDILESVMEKMGARTWP